MEIMEAFGKIENEDQKNNNVACAIGIVAAQNGCSQMKCVLIASEGSEVLFYCTDDEFQANLRQRYGSAEQRQAPTFADGINTLFAPLLISCFTLLEKLEDTYTCFTTENGHLCVLHQFGECLYIALNGDGAENEDDLHRKLFVLKRLCEAHFSFITLDGNLLKKALRPTDTQQRDRVWALFQGLLQTYDRLRNEEQSFVVEAVERLICPDQCELCIEILERQVVQLINSRSERGGEEVVHAFILVHSKLLAFFSSRNASSVRAADLLTLILIVQNMYPSSCKEEELDLQPAEGNITPGRLNISDTISVPPREGTPASSGNVGLELEIETSATEIKREHGYIWEDQQWHVEVEPSAGPEEYYTPDPSPSSNQGVDDLDDGIRAFRFANSDVQMAEDSLLTLEATVPEPTNPTRIFIDANLPQGYCPMMPHALYCLPLWPGISLVLLTKIPNSNVALSFYQLLSLFSVLEKKLKHKEVGQSRMAELQEKTERFVKNFVGKDDELQIAWNKFKKIAFSRSEDRTSEAFVSSLLKECASVKSQLCSVYRRCFLLSPAGSRSQISQTLQDKVKHTFQEELMHRKDFILVKSMRNITLRPYLDEYPGLVHFIYVDRTAGQMISPSINISEKSTSEFGTGPMASFVKNKIWSLIRMSRRYLQKGYTTLTFRDGDYHCSFFLWFENETGDKLEVIEHKVPSDDSVPVGMLAGEYYRNLLHWYSQRHRSDIVKCYELFTIHLGIIPTDYIIQQCCTLAQKLWEPSRIPLL